MWLDSINVRMERLFNQASSVILADISIDCLEHVSSLEVWCAWYHFFSFHACILASLVCEIHFQLPIYSCLTHPPSFAFWCISLSLLWVIMLPFFSSLQLYPSHLPDLSSGSPLIVSGRYTGNFPHLVKFSGTLADLGNFMVSAKVQKAKDFPMERVIFSTCSLWKINWCFLLWFFL